MKILNSYLKFLLLSFKGERLDYLSNKHHVNLYLFDQFSHMSMVHQLSNTRTVCTKPWVYCYSVLLVCNSFAKKRKLDYLVWGEAETAGGISKDSQVIPQRPTWTAAASGSTFNFPPHMLLAQILELSLGPNLHQTRERLFELMPSFETNLQKKNKKKMRQCSWSSVFNFSNCGLRL